MKSYDKSSDTKLATNSQTEESALDGGIKTGGDTSAAASGTKQANPTEKPQRRYCFWEATECKWCSTELTPETSVYTFEVPLARGGSIDMENMVAVCERCYELKGLAEGHELVCVSFS